MAGQAPEQSAFWGALVVLATATIAVLQLFGAPRWAIVLAIVTGVVAGVSHLLPRTRGRRLAAWGMLAFLGVSCLGVAVTQDMATAQRDVPAVEGLADDEAFLQAVDACSANECKLIKRLSLGTGGSNAYAGVVERKVDLGIESTTLLILSGTGDLRWSRRLNAGYGLTDLDTDATGHLLATLAVNNHTTVGWVLGISDTSVDDFGTVSGLLPLSGFRDADLSGLRRPYKERYSWLAVADGAPDVSDVYAWDGTVYKLVGCQFGDGGDVRPSSSGTCT